MTTEEMWEAYRLINSQIGDEIDAWQFGAEPDLLADLVLKGEKTATSSLYDLYEYSNEALPKVGEYSIIQNSKGQAVCVIKTTKVMVCPFEKVSAEHAFKEGENDRSLSSWRQLHEALFREWLAQVNYSFSPDRLVVLEEFQVVYPVSTKDLP